MRQKKRNALLNRKETQTLLTTLKMASTAGVLSLTLLGWGTLAQLEAGKLQLNTSQPVTAAVAQPSAPATKAVTKPSAPVARTIRKLNVVQWVQDRRGDRVAVVRDSRGGLWYVMADDVTRLEQGLAPQVQPQPVRIVTRSRAS